VPIIRRKLVYLCYTVIFSLSMGGVWSAGWIEIQPAAQTPLRVTNISVA